jgi:TctA family transporter
MVLAGFAALGVLLVTLNFQPIPLLLGFVLGPLAEENLRRAMAISGGSFRMFIERPVCLVLVIMLAVLIALSLMSRFRASREVFSDV